MVLMEPSALNPSDFLKKSMKNKFKKATLQGRVGRSPTRTRSVHSPLGRGVLLTKLIKLNIKKKQKIK